MARTGFVARSRADRAMRLVAGIIAVARIRPHRPQRKNEIIAGPNTNAGVIADRGGCDIAGVDTIARAHPDGMVRQIARTVAIA